MPQSTNKPLFLPGQSVHLHVTVKPFSKLFTRLSFFLFPPPKKTPNSFKAQLKNCPHAYHSPLLLRPNPVPIQIQFKQKIP